LFSALFLCGGNERQLEVSEGRGMDPLDFPEDGCQVDAVASAAGPTSGGTAGAGAHGHPRASAVGATCDDFDRPDLLVFKLDPGPGIV
jgi:hypothetical protein